MQIIVGNQLRINEPTENVLAWCKQNLILDNPDYAKKVRMHLWVGNTPQKLFLMQWDADTLIIPYGCLSAILSLERDADVISDLPEPTVVDFQGEVPLYDYQEEARAALEAAYYGSTACRLLSYPQNEIHHHGYRRNGSQDEPGLYHNHEAKATVIQGEMRQRRYDLG